jgi:GAF domain-containing protein
VALAATALAAGAREILAPWLEGRAPLVTFFGSVMIAAWYGGLGPALFALVLGLAAATVFFFPLANFGTDETVLLALYALAGIVTAILSGSLHAARQRTVQQVEALLSVQKQLREEIIELSDAQQHLKFLADASAALASLVDFQCTLRRVAHVAIPFFADWCAVDVMGLDGAWCRLCAGPSERPDVRASQDLDRCYAMRRKAPFEPGHVLHTARAELLEVIPDSALAEWAKNPDHLSRLKALRPQSSVSVPLKMHGGLLGVMTFVRVEEDHRFRPADLAVAEELARRAAIAIENGRLYAELMVRRKTDSEPARQALDEHLARPITPGAIQEAFRAAPRERERI